MQTIRVLSAKVSSLMKKKVLVTSLTCATTCIMLPVCNYGWIALALEKPVVYTALELSTIRAAFGLRFPGSTLICGSVWRRRYLNHLNEHMIPYTGTGIPGAQLTRCLCRIGPMI